VLRTFRGLQSSCRRDPRYRPHLLRAAIPRHVPASSSDRGLSQLGGPPIAVGVSSRRDGHGSCAATNVTVDRLWPDGLTSPPRPATSPDRRRRRADRPATRPARLRHSRLERPRTGRALSSTSDRRFGPGARSTAYEAAALQIEGPIRRPRLRSAAPTRYSPPLELCVCRARSRIAAAFALCWHGRPGSIRRPTRHRRSGSDRPRFEKGLDRPSPPPPLTPPIGVPSGARPPCASEHARANSSTRGSRCVAIVTVRGRGPGWGGYVRGLHARRGGGRDRTSPRRVEATRRAARYRVRPSRSTYLRRRRGAMVPRGRRPRGIEILCNNAGNPRD